MRRALVACLIVGCGMGDFGAEFGDPGPGGIDPGGVQDIGYVRDVINHGGVPAADAIMVEGLLSEHDLPTIGPPCHSLMCIRPAIGVAPSLETGRLERWIHVGMVTGIDLETFTRPPLDVVVLIDKSSSMSIDITETTEAVAHLVDHLTVEDRAAVLAFDDAIHVLHPFGTVRDPAALKAAVRGIAAGGSWEIERPMAEGYRIAGAADGTGRLRRVIVLSCGYPSLSPGLDNPLAQLVRDQGRAGVGLTFVGVLLGFSPPLGDLLGASNGGNYYYLQDLSRVEQVFDDEFDFMVTPAAYDMRLRIELAAGLSLERLYGIPGDHVGAPRAEVDIATAFFSRRRGAIVARLARVADAGEDLGAVALAYRPEPALGIAATDEEVVPVRGPRDDTIHYDSDGVRVAVALVNQAERMRAACSRWAEHKEDAARAILRELSAYLAGEAKVLPGLQPEVDLVNKLLRNMGG